MSQLLRRIEKFLSASAITARQFGQDAVNDPRLVFDMRKGRTLRPRTEERVEAFLADPSAFGPASPRPSRSWTPEMDARLWEAAALGSRRADIAERLGVSVFAAQARLHALADERIYEREHGVRLRDLIRLDEHLIEQAAVAVRLTLGGREQTLVAVSYA